MVATTSPCLPDLLIPVSLSPLRRVHAGVGRKLNDPRGERIEFSPPAGEFFLPLGQTELRLGDPIAALDQPAGLFRVDMVRQARGRKGLAPAPAGGLVLLFGFARAAGGGVGLLPGRVAAGLQRRKLLEGRQFLLGRLQPAGDRAAAAGQLGVQGVAVALGLLDLRLEHAELFLARIEPPGVRRVRASPCRRPRRRRRPDPARPASGRPSR